MAIQAVVYVIQNIQDNLNLNYKKKNKIRQRSVGKLFRKTHKSKVSINPRLTAQSIRSQVKGIIAM